MVVYAAGAVSLASGAATASPRTVAQLALGRLGSTWVQRCASQPRDAFTSDLELLCTSLHQPWCSQGGRRALQLAPRPRHFAPA